MFIWIIWRGAVIWGYGEKGIAVPRAHFNWRP